MLLFISDQYFFFFFFASMINFMIVMKTNENVLGITTNVMTVKYMENRPCYVVQYITEFIVYNEINRNMYSAAR